MRAVSLILVALFSMATWEARAQLAAEGGPIDIVHADHGVFDRTMRKASFRGSVDVRQARVALKCDALNLYFAPANSNDGGSTASVFGAQLGPAERMECIGNVVYENPIRRVTANRGEYSASNRLITLSGNVTSVEAGRSLRGAQMTINPDTGAVTIRGAGGVFGGGN